MRAKDIIIGEQYNIKDCPTRFWARAVEILPPKTKENNTNRIVVKCRWSSTKDDSFAMIKYFRPSNIIKN